MKLIEGYRIMFCYLDAYYRKNKSDELGGLLGSMSLLSDDTTADPAYKEDWEAAVSQIMCQREVQDISSDTVYWAMITFLRDWSYLGTDGTVSSLCEKLEKSNPKSDEWLQTVKSVMGGNDQPYLSLINSTE